MDPPGAGGDRRETGLRAEACRESFVGGSVEKKKKTKRLRFVGNSVSPLRQRTIDGYTATDPGRTD